MYDRKYQDKTITFEASGGLLNSALVMQDRETDSYWPIMQGEAIAGEMKGTKLKEMPVAEKVQWKDWVKKHPNTLVLSVNGREDGFNPYKTYFESKEGFRGTAAKDRRLATKEPIFAFHYQGKSYAVPYKNFEGGKTFDLNGVKLFLYRPPKSEIFYSTAAFAAAGDGFKIENGKWYHVDSGCQFNPNSGSFEKGPGACPEKFHGFDTFWYNWSLSNPDTQLLR